MGAAMAKPRVYGDYHNADPQGRVRLNTAGTLQDLARQGLRLHDGLALTLYSDDENAAGEPDELTVEGVVTWSAEEHCWVAAIDWDAIRHASDDPRRRSDGAENEPGVAPDEARASPR